MSSFFPVNQIVAFDSNFGIGITDVKGQGKLPWSLPEEFRRFLRIVTETSDTKPAVAWLMGRESYDLLFIRHPEILSEMDKSVRLIKVVMTRNSEIEAAGPKEEDKDVFLCSNWEQVQNVLVRYSNSLHAAWNIGGPAIYSLQLSDSKVAKERMRGSKLYITKIKGDFKCDMLYPGKWMFEEKSTVLEECLELKEDFQQVDVSYTCHVYKFISGD